MVGPIQSERTSSPAAAIVARLLNGYFGCAAGDAIEIDSEVAHDVLRIARANKILKPVLNSFDKIGVPIPEGARPEIAAYSRKAMRNNAAALATLCEIATILSDAGIVHAAFKGPARQIALGQDVFERPVADVDILVKRSDFVRATNLLKEMGYWIPLFCRLPLVAPLSGRTSANSERSKPARSRSPS